ncbi:MAG: hypothetical protein ABL998_14230, partial [Planctomycetota bacterium]
GNYQGNVADICPVGALTLDKFRFQARVWNLTKAPSTCGECSRGCSITVEVLRRQEVKRLRPRPNPEVNKYWMCDHWRFSFEGLNTSGRLAGALARGGSGLAPVEPAVALDEFANLMRVHGAPLVVASPWVTQEEGKLLAALASEATFVSPPPSPLEDDLLHTGDPCPNRRGLSELGFTPLDAEAARTKLAGATFALLVGERVADRLGREALASLPAGLRLVVLDTHPLDVPSAELELGVPNAVERTGTWLNIDGVRGTLAIARSAPAGVAPLVRTLEEVARRTSATGVAR